MPVSHTARGRAVPPVLDLLLAAALAVGAQVGIWTGRTAEGPRSVTVVTALLITVPLAWRRVAPEVTVVLTIAGVVAQTLLAESAQSIWALAVLLLVGFSLGAGVAGRRGAWLGGALVAAVWLSTLLGADSQLGDKLFTAPLLGGGPVVAGFAVRRQRERAERLARLATELERDREDRARAAVADERSRIARELHDIVAHTVSVMVVQAGAADELMQRDPPAASRSLQAVRDSGKQALVELRRLLGVLRTDGTEPGSLSPQPGLADVDRLLAEQRSAGLGVELEYTGRHDALPPGLDLAAYRVVQEALTNVRKHAGPGAQARVGLHVDAGAVTVEVSDDGGAAALKSTTLDGTTLDGTTLDGTGVKSTGDGHGLVGMRERTMLYGGSLQVGPVPAGGWRVRVVLPVVHRVEARQEHR